MRWNAFGADASDAFLQGTDLGDLAIEMYRRDVRRRRDRLLQSKQDYCLKTLEPRFGDVRALRWESDKAAEIVEHMGFVRHPLDRCVFLSFNGTTMQFSVAEGKDQLDGVVGLHGG